MYTYIPVLSDSRARASRVAVATLVAATTLLAPTVLAQEDKYGGASNADVRSPPLHGKRLSNPS